MKRVLIATLAVAVGTSTASLSAADSRRVTDRQRDSELVDIPGPTLELDQTDRLHVHAVAPNEEAVLMARQKPPIVATGTGRPISLKILIVIGLSVVALWIIDTLLEPYS